MVKWKGKIRTFDKTSDGTLLQSAELSTLGELTRSASGGGHETRGLEGSGLAPALADGSPVDNHFASARFCWPSVLKSHFSGDGGSVIPSVVI